MEFKERTARKVLDLRCPIHRRPPKILFRGSSLRDVSIQLSGCCDTLIALANQRIAEQPAQISSPPPTAKLVPAAFTAPQSET
jgi:hypothetical protein